MWPEPDLPRTSTGKVRRKIVMAWLASSRPGRADEGSTETTGLNDWLVALVAQISGETAPGTGDELRLNEDFHLDSLGRVQLGAAIEARMGGAGNGGLEQVRTLGELRLLLRTSPMPGATAEPVAGPVGVASSRGEITARSLPIQHAALADSLPTTTYLYPKWPWWRPVQWLRVAFLEIVTRALVWILADPIVVLEGETLGAEGSQPFDEKTPDGWGSEGLGESRTGGGGPMLIVANHVTTYDGPLLQYALPGRIRRHMAAAMSGEMLEDFRHFRDPDAAPGTTRFSPFGPLAYVALTALFNVFPLPRQRDFQRSFAHAGEALDRGYNVLVFPEGTRSAAGELARFRPGIGLLVKQAGTAVLPMAIRGLGELKERRRGWFRSGTVEVRIGRPIRFSPFESEAAITARLHAEVERLLQGSGFAGQRVSELAN